MTRRVEIFLAVAFSSSSVLGSVLGWAGTASAYDLDPDGAALVGPVCTAPASPVALIDPTVLGDGTPGSVSRADIQAALDAGGHIAFDLGLDPVTIVLDQELVVTREVVLDGGRLVTLSGGDATRIMRVVRPLAAEDTYTVTLQHLTLAHGRTSSTTPFEDSGAAILAPHGGAWQVVRLVAVDCTFADNTAVATGPDSGGGALYAIGLDRVVLVDSVFERNLGSNGGAVYSLGSRQVLVSGCTFRANQATGVGSSFGNGGNAGALGVDGAARTVRVCGTRFIDNTGNAHGAGFFSVMYDTESLTEFVATTFQGNSNPTGDFHTGGAYIQGGPFSIRETTFRANQANQYGGLFLGPDATGDIANSTFSENLARQGLGGAIAIGTSQPVEITHCTIADNHAPVAFAGGIAIGSSNALTIRNTILSGNTGGNVWNPWNIQNAAAGGGGNVQWPRWRPNEQEEVPATADLAWADPLLDPLAGNGGPTETMALAQGSPAIDTAPGADCPAADQRGYARPVDGDGSGGAACDVGAFEAGAGPPVSVADFNEDRRDDVGVFRNGMWFITHSPDYSNVDQAVAFGSTVPGRDLPQVGEFGCAGGGSPDRKTDLAILRQPFSTWQVTLSPAWTGIPDLSVTFGTTAHKKVPTIRFDTNGDGCSDIAVFRNGCFHVLESPDYSGVDRTVCFGLASDEPLAADLNGDGLADLGLWRPSGAFYWQFSPDYSGPLEVATGFGTAGDVPVLGEFERDGRADLGVYRPGSSSFFFTYSPDFSGLDLSKVHGVPGDVPILADVNGDGESDLGVFRDGVARWFFLCSPGYAGSCLSQSFGLAGDIPIYGKPPGMP